MGISLIKKGFNAVSSTYNNVLAKIAVAATVGLASLQASANYDFDTMVENGQTAEDVANNTENVMKIVFGVIKALGVLVGFWLVYSGIMRIKKANEPNSNVSPMQGALFILLGGCLGALPFIFLSSATIVQG